MQKSRDWFSSEHERRPRIVEPGPIPTIGALMRGDVKWMWANCERIGCGHSAPVALAPLAICSGPDASTDFIRECLHYSKCCRKGGVVIEVRDSPNQLD